MPGRKATANFWTVLGARPLLGRVFTEAEDTQGVRVAVISYAVGRVLGDAVTMRNWATVMKLHTLAADRVSSAGRSSG